MPVYRLIQHRNCNRIAVLFEYDSKINERLRKNPDALWSRTLQCWHIPDTAENRVKCGISSGTQVVKVEKTDHKSSGGKRQIYHEEQSQSKFHRIVGSNIHAMESFLQTLALKAYSRSTIKTYRNEFGIFLQALGKVPAESLTVGRIKDYLQYCFTEYKLSENTIHSRINALKFYYEQVLKRENSFGIYRARRNLFITEAAQ